MEKVIFELERKSLGSIQTCTNTAVAMNSRVTKLAAVLLRLGPNTKCFQVKFIFGYLKLASAKDYACIIPPVTFSPVDYQYEAGFESFDVSCTCLTLRRFLIVNTKLPSLLLTVTELDLCRFLCAVFILFSINT